jgi:hypothetical protein
MKTKMISFLIIALAIFQPDDSKGQGNKKVIKTLSNSLYSKQLYIHDGDNFVLDIYYGKKEAHAKETTRQLGHKDGTVVFESSIDPAEVFDFIENADKLIFKNGKAYIDFDHGVRFLTEVEFVGNCSMPEGQLRKALDEFSKECSSNDISPDLVVAEFYTDKMEYALIAIQLAPGGHRRTLLQRVNTRTTKNNLPMPGTEYMVRN